MADVIPVEPLVIGAVRGGHQGRRGGQMEWAFAPLVTGSLYGSFKAEREGPNVGLTPLRSEQQRHSCSLFTAIGRVPAKTSQ